MTTTMKSIRALLTAFYKLKQYYNGNSIALTSVLHK